MKKSSEVIGIGTDIIEIKRIEESIQQYGDRFLTKLFTQKEIEYCKRHQDSVKRFAGRFAAKEAIAKSLGFGFGKNVAWTQIEILPDENGKPVVTYPGYQFDLSISHCNDYAIAMAIAYKI